MADANFHARAIVLLGSLLVVQQAEAAPTAGAAPAGDPGTVAFRIIKNNFDACTRVTSASRMPQGQIIAVCSGTQYLVFTIFDPKAGKLHELALNCAAAKRHLGIVC